MTTTNNIYKDNGYRDRQAYLRSVAEDYGVSYEYVVQTAELLGPSEDFDGLISLISDYSDMLDSGCMGW